MMVSSRRRPADVNSSDPSPASGTPSRTPIVGPGALSGGEQQRAQFARCLVQDPELLVIRGHLRLPGMHGEAGLETGVLLACGDGVLWVTGTEGECAAEKLPYPEGTAPEDRTWSFPHAHGVPLVAGVLGEDAVLVVDTETAEAAASRCPSLRWPSPSPMPASTSWSSPPTASSTSSTPPRGRSSPAVR